MASESADPPAPQSEVVTTSTHNAKARLNAYTDTSLTKRNVTQPDGTVPGNNNPKHTGSSTNDRSPQGNVRAAYAEDRVAEIDQEASNPDAEVPEHSGNAWQIETTADDIQRPKDYYRNGGMIGQDFLNNG